MATRVLLTVDTELGWGPYSEGAGWEENLRRSFDPAGVGVPWQLQRLAENGLKAVFFVDPMPGLVYGIEPIRRMVEPILAAGQEVQLHLHPVWASIAAGKPAGEKFELTCFDAEEQRELITTARRLLMEAGARDPIAFRSGSYAANGGTLAALRALGLRYDSSHNGSYAPDPSALPLPPQTMAPVEVDGVIEVPVTQIEDSARSLRHLQLCALSSDEIQACLLHAADEGHPTAVLVTHGFELASRDGKRANRVLCRRFERLCAFLADRADILPTAHFRDLEHLVLDADATPLPASPLRRTRRLAEQAWSNALYERAL